MPRPSRASMIGLSAACFAALTLYTPGALAVVTRTSVISTYAGTGAAKFSGDRGPARRAGLNQPRDTAVGPDGSVYVADTFNNRIQKFTPEGHFLGAWGHRGAGHGQFSEPRGVASFRGQVFVADTYNHRIQRLTP